VIFSDNNEGSKPAGESDISEGTGKGVGVRGGRSKEFELTATEFSTTLEDRLFLQRIKRRIIITIEKNDTTAPIIAPQGIVCVFGVALELAGLEVLLGIADDTVDENGGNVGLLSSV